jgi:hypothetical protein
MKVCCMSPQSSCLHGLDPWTDTTGVCYVKETCCPEVKPAQHMAVRLYKQLAAVSTNTAVSARVIAYDEAVCYVKESC